MFYLISGSVYILSHGKRHTLQMFMYCVFSE